MNRATLIGNVGRDPEIRSTQSGQRIANFTLATSERWTDKNSGEKREATEWHRVVIFNEKLVDLAERFIRKGTKLALEGEIKTRQWDDKGQTRYTTEIVLQRFGGSIELLGGGEKREGAPEIEEEPPF
jgi:single-strand DNA-binding protein